MIPEDGNICDLLGHSDVSTTLIYIKVSNKNISKIKSPFDQVLHPGHQYINHLSLTPYDVYKSK